MKDAQTIFLKKEDVCKGSLILVNTDCPIHEESKIEKVRYAPVNNEFPDIIMEAGAAEILRSLLLDIGAKDQIVPVSGYRTAQEQTKIYETSKKENGEAFTRKFVALPYCSEHQTGLAMDLGLKKEEIDFICPDFPYEGVCQKFREAAPSYGFVERYRKGKEKITGICAEPWHFRYVGKPHARIMTKHGWALEEYHSFLKNYDRKHPYVFEEKNVRTKIFFVPAEKEATEIHLPVPAKNVRRQISGNNMDGFIVTVSAPIEDQ